MKKKLDKFTNKIAQINFESKEFANKDQLEKDLLTEIWAKEIKLVSEQKSRT